MDPAVAYDILWEVANRLGAFYAEQVVEGGPQDPAVVMMREISTEVEAVPPGDPAALAAKTTELAQRYEAVTRIPTCCRGLPGYEQ